MTDDLPDLGSAANDERYRRTIAIIFAVARDDLQASAALLNEATVNPDEAALHLGILAKAAVRLGRQVAGSAFERSLEQALLEAVTDDPDDGHPRTF